MKDSKETPLKPGEIREYILNDYCKGYATVKDNCWNYSIFAQDPNSSIFENEFYAGFIQAKVQGELSIKAARDNVWRNFLINYTPQDAISITITKEMSNTAEQSLTNNLNYIYNWIKKNEDAVIPMHIKRLYFRMAGIWAGVNYEKAPDIINFDTFDPSKIDSSELKLGGYDTKKISFLDIYLINAEMDMYDVISDKIGISYGTDGKSAKPAKPDHCSAFVYMNDGEIYWTHNSWSGFFAQSCAVTYTIGEDFVTLNAYSQGQFGSNTDFGFNKHGICFNETTITYEYNEPKELGVWTTWRSASAEMFATSIQDFYDHMAIDNTATYQNGYQLVDVFRNEIGLFEMAYNRYVLFTSDGTKLNIFDSTGYKPTPLDYDPHLITPTHILGVNQPVYHKIGYALGSMNARPKRRVQFYNRMYTVVDMESCKDLITYTEELEPLSIYGRWDLSYGTTEFARTRPDGSMDAKAFRASEVRTLLQSLHYKPNKDSEKTSFWMKYGTPFIVGKPFSWSKSRFKEFKRPQSEDFVPDEVTGKFNLVKLFMD